ncbi:DUF6318 family protein [Kribbella sp. NPDC026611]|uniref:DUF6318 family protein n=1 Tax=Kribbella sp. NPDC026611 TaxID=3154911 RepID=UPI0033E27A9D
MTNRNRQPSLLLTCLTTAVLTAACTSGSPEAGHPDTAPPPSSSDTSESTPSGSPSSTPSAPASAPPTRPAAADGLTLGAAEAFYRYYIDLKNYAAATGDTAALLSASESGCEGCNDYAQYVAKVNEANGGISGDYRERVKDVSQLVRGSTGRVGGSAVIAVGTFTTKNSPTSKPIISKPAEYTDTISLSPKGQNWVMYEMLFEER